MNYFIQEHLTIEKNEEYFFFQEHFKNVGTLHIELPLYRLILSEQS